MDGIAVGGLYALIALGYTMVYGILQFINFAHSDVFMLGAWMSFVIARAAGFGEPGATPGFTGALYVLAGATLFCGTLGYAVERLAYRPLRNVPRLNVLITAIGVSLFLQNTGQLNLFLGTQPQRMPALIEDSPLWEIAAVHFRAVDLLVVAGALVLMGFLQWLVFATKLGKAMQAVSYNAKVAALMGIPVDRVISFTFVTGSVLAAAAGFLYAAKYPGLNQPAHTTWVLLGLKAFVAAVAGGIGNIRGAMVGGLLIGMVELFGAAYLSPHLRDVYVFALLIAVLLLRPAGIMGRAAVEKV